MSDQSRIVSPGPDDRSVRTAAGEVLHPPENWVLVPPGDAALTRRIKAAACTWSVQVKKGRKVFSRGIWAPQAVVEAVRQALAGERSTPQYARRRQADARRRQQQHDEYALDFERAVLRFLDFDPRYADLAHQMARAVAAQATPVGSGTVARTQRISIERRAEAAVLAWMRHHTTAYDRMTIPRQKGKRRQVRRLLAQRSRSLLDTYRQGKPIEAGRCPLQAALSSQEMHRDGHHHEPSPADSGAAGLPRQHGP